MSEARWRLVPLACAALLLAGQLGYIALIGNGLSYLADPYSEANAIRAGEGYAAKGFLADWGLPDTAFGGRFAGKGILSRDPPPEVNIYTHYPPGADLMAGAWTMVFGEGNIALFRVPVVLAGVGAFWFLCASIGRVFGARAAGACAIALLLVPATSTHMHSLHYHGLGFALLLAQAGALVRLLGQREARAAAWLAMIGACGFLQGTLSFDWAFVVSFLGLGMGIVAVADGRATWGRVAAAVVVPGAAFTAAHGLHVLQVAGYWGGLDAALADLLESAGERGTGADGGQFLPARPLFLVPFTTLVLALVHLGPVHAALLAAAGLLVAGGRAEVSLGQGPHVVLELPGGRWPTVAALAVSLAVSNAWTIVMAQHAASHWHFVPRHHFALLLTALFALLSAARRGQSPGGE